MITENVFVNTTENRNQSLVNDRYITAYLINLTTLKCYIYSCVFISRLGDREEDISDTAAVIGCGAVSRVFINSSRDVRLSSKLPLRVTFRKLTCCILEPKYVSFLLLSNAKRGFTSRPET